MKLPIWYLLHKDEARTTFEVTVFGVEDALCAISREGILLGYAYTDESGQATITFDPIIGEDPPLDLVVSFYNKIPYLAQIPVIVNNVPEIPEKPEGPTSIKVGTEETYSTVTTDPDNDPVFYMWRWGDGNYSEWLGPFDSEETVTASHIWTTPGSYNIRVKAKDINDQESDWSEKLQISVTKDRTLQSSFLLRFFEKFPNAILILRHILGL